MSSAADDSNVIAANDSNAIAANDSNAIAANDSNAIAANGSNAAVATDDMAQWRNGAHGREEHPWNGTAIREMWENLCRALRAEALSSDTQAGEKRKRGGTTDEETLSSHSVNRYGKGVSEELDEDTLSSDSIGQGDGSPEDNSERPDIMHNDY